MDRKNTVLIAVDLQKGFIKKGSGIIIPKVLKLVDFFVAKGMPVIFTKNRNYSGSQYHKLIGWKRLMKSPETDFVDELQPYKKIVIDKTIYSAFTPEFNMLVKNKKWKNFILCGIATDNCILKTAVDAFEKGFRPIVITDATYSHGGKKYHKAGLMILERLIGKKQLINSRELFRLLKD